MKSAIIVFPGTNREHDMVDALMRIHGQPPVLVWHRADDLPKVDLIVLPGGFSYGDYLRTGAIAAHSPVMREVVRRAEAGTPVLGVCNGFQILCETGLLPGVLLRNSGLGFICRDVHLRIETSQSLFTNRYTSGQVLRVPVAHGDGAYFADAATLQRIEGEGQVAFRYCNARGDLDNAANPNGSANHIAGVFNRTKTVLGLMPHPENATDPVLAGPTGGSTDGRALFEGLAAALS